MSSLTVRQAIERPLRGNLRVPGDKSISHRSILFGSLAQGITRIDGLLEGEDVLSTIDIMKKLGVEICKQGKVWAVAGRGPVALRSPAEVLHCGNSGTTLRLMTGLLSGLPVVATLTGDASLNARPMGRVMEPLRRMGAKIEETKSGGGRWIKVHGRRLHSIRYRLPVASAQLKSALLLAGLVSGVPVEIREPEKSRDHTERMLRAFGAKVRVQGLKVILKPSLKLKAQRIIVPSDFSSAAFFLVAGLLHPHPKTRIVLKNVGINPTRTGLLKVLSRMGGRLRVFNKKIVCGEPVADLEARPSRLRGIRVPKSMIPSLIDEVPILSVAAALAKGKTTLQGAQELRVKETDRIRSIATELPKFGVLVRERSDGLEIEGRKAADLRGTSCQSHGDHRMAMSLAILGCLVAGGTQVKDTDCIQTSFPNFQKCLRQIGGNPESL